MHRYVAQSRVHSTYPTYSELGYITMVPWYIYTGYGGIRAVCAVYIHTSDTLDATGE